MESNISKKKQHKHKLVHEFGTPAPEENLAPYPDGVNAQKSQSQRGGKNGK